MIGVETYSFIDRGGIIWDRAGDFSKFIDRGSHQGAPHRGASHRGTRTVCVTDLKEAKRQLNYADNYRELQEDPTAKNMKLVNDAIEKFKKQKLINEKVT